MPLTSLEPADAATVAAMLAVAASDGTAFVPQGHGTKLQRHSLAAGASPLSTTRLTAGLAHYAGDLVATAPAGATLRDVNAVLARERQWIPLDPPHGDSATIGGIVACNDSGPRRHRFGTPRDLIIGIEVALTSGRVVHSGGRVVKNVAGYDLSRLFCGSRGSLGVITTVTFKLAPLAPTSRTLVAQFTDTTHAVDAALRIAASAALTPSALELVAPESQVLVRFETTPRAGAHMSAAARSILEASGAQVSECEGDEEARLWEAHTRRDEHDDGLMVALSVLPSHVAATVQHVDRLAREHGVEWTITGRSALGVLRLAARASTAAQGAFIVALRTAVSSLHGSLQVLRSDANVALPADAAGDVGTAAAIGFAVKRRFDPAGVLPYLWPRV